ncbi:hypothetical protein [uncultured Mediterranean phage uvMED]|nr:hypothetical protein [uncultured Mediterranean phage uvMED]
MSRNLIVYKVDYKLVSDPYREDRFIKTKRIVMLPHEVPQKTGYWLNHNNVEKKFFKQMEGKENCTYCGDKYRVTKVRKAR